MRSRAVALAALLGVAAGCGSGGDDHVVVEDGGLAILDAWTRPSPPRAAEAAIYVTIANRSAPDDRLIGSASERCMVMHPHLTEFDGDVAVMSTADGDELALPVGGEVTMEPNGLHLMCLGLDAPLVAGERFEIELDFHDHAPIVVPVAVEAR